jgi:hypothetical protein
LKERDYTFTNGKLIISSVPEWQKIQEWKNIADGYKDANMSLSLEGVTHVKFENWGLSVGIQNKNAIFLKMIDA